MEGVLVLGRVGPDRRYGPEPGPDHRPKPNLANTLPHFFFLLPWLGPPPPSVGGVMGLTGLREHLLKWGVQLTPSELDPYLLSELPTQLEGHNVLHVVVDASVQTVAGLRSPTVHVHGYTLAAVALASTPDCVKKRNR